MLQLDCPDDTESYIHRVGRTARHKSKGSGLLVLLPSEAPAMVPLLKQARIPLNQIRVNSKRAVSVNAKIAAEVAADPELRQLAKKAFVSYLRSVYLQPNKDVFGPPASLPVREFALVRTQPCQGGGAPWGSAPTPAAARTLNLALAYPLAHPRLPLAHAPLPSTNSRWACLPSPPPSSWRVRQPATLPAPRRTRARSCRS